MNENREIDLLQLASAVLKKWWIVAVTTVLAGILAFSYTYLCVEPTYQASALFYVNNSKLSLGSTSISLSSGDITAAKSLVDTYRVILKSRLNLEEVIKKANLGYSYEELSEMITAESVNNTEVFSVTVTGKSPQEACEIANTIAIVLPEKVTGIIEGTSVKVVDYAVVPTKRFAPSYSKNTIIGVLLGFVASVAVIVVMELLNDSIKSEDWLVTTFGDEIPLLAVVPDVTVKSRHYGKYGYYYTESAAQDGNKGGRNG